MNRTTLSTAVLAAAVAAVAGTPLVASAAEGTLYGSLRAGIVSGDDDVNGRRLDLGATNSDGSIGGQGLYSRIGVRGSADLGNGSSAGLQVERSVEGTLGNRLHNVWIDGAWGRLTLGQQNNPYRSARKWDQTWFMGGQFGADRGSRIEGVNYSSNLAGPFSFSVMATANDTDTANDDVDGWTVTAGYDFGLAKLDVAHETNEIDGQGFDNTAIGINGSVGAFGWYLAYQSADDNSDAGANDTDSIGGFASISLSDTNIIYAYHVNHSGDGANAFGSATLGSDPTETVLGYSHSFGGGVTFIAEYLNRDLDTGTAGSDPDLLALALKVDF